MYLVLGDTGFSMTVCENEVDFTALVSIFVGAVRGMSVGILSTRLEMRVCYD